MFLTQWRPARATYNPFQDSFLDFGQLARELGRWFDTPQTLGQATSLASGPAPAMDLREHDEAWIVTADLPGVDRKDVELVVEKDLLTIRARKEFSGADQGEVIRNERFFGNIERTLRLPSEVNSEKIKATLKNGVLTVELPKRPESQPRQIKVQVK